MTDAPRPARRRSSSRPAGSAARAAPFSITGVRRLGEVPDQVEGGPRVAIDLVEVTYDDGGRRTSSTSCRSRSTPSRRTGSTTRSSAGGTTRTSATSHVYDAAARPRGDGRLAALRSTQPADRAARSTFHRLPGPRARPRGALDAVQRRAVQLLGGLRRGRAAEGLPQGHPGRQPRHRDPRGADPRPGPTTSPRSTAGSTPSTTTTDAILQLAMLQQFLRTASDGWDLGAGQRPQPVRRGRPARRRGGRRLRRRGRAARRGAGRGAPRVLAEHFPTDGRTADRAGRAGRRDDRPARRRARRRARARAVRRRRCARAFDAVADARRRRASSRSTATCTSARPCAPSRAGRSSTSRASRPSRWPSGCCPTRRGATSPGCCAPSTTPPRVVERTWPATPTTTGAEQRAYRAAEWSERNRAAFLAAYAGRELTADEQTLLDAYVADKAVYETVYEARNRPTWVADPARRPSARIGAS